MQKVVCRTEEGGGIRSVSGILDRWWRARPTTLPLPKDQAVSRTKEQSDLLDPILSGILDRSGELDQRYSLHAPAMVPPEIVHDSPSAGSPNLAIAVPGRPPLSLQRYRVLPLAFVCLWPMRFFSTG